MDQADLGRLERQMRRLVIGSLALVTGAVVGLGVARAISTPDEHLAAAPRAAPASAASPRALASDLDCAPGELVAARFLGNSRTSVGRTSAAEALQRDLSEYPKFEAESFREVARATAGVGQHIQFVYETEGKRVAQLVATNDGQGWHLGKLVACNSMTGRS